MADGQIDRLTYDGRTDWQTQGKRAKKKLLYFATNSGVGITIAYQKRILGGRGWAYKDVHFSLLAFVNDLLHKPSFEKSSLYIAVYQIFSFFSFFLFFFFFCCRCCCCYRSLSLVGWKKKHVIFLLLCLISLSWAVSYEQSLRSCCIRRQSYSVQQCCLFSSGEALAC